MQEDIVEHIAEMNPDALIADGLESALVGYTVNHHHAYVAVYDVDKCIELFVTRDGLTHAEAEEHVSFNVLGAYVGENGPLFVRFSA